MKTTLKSGDDPALTREEYGAVIRKGLQSEERPKALLVNGENGCDERAFSISTFSSLQGSRCAHRSGAACALGNREKI